MSAGKRPNLILIAKAEDFQRSDEPPLSIGTVVRLNSGGPAMVVVDCAERGQVTAAWRDANGAPREADFPVAAVHRVELGSN